MDNNLCVDEVGENSALIMAFVAACNDKDIDRMMGYFDHNSLYHNIPLEPITGVEAIRAVLEPFFAATSRVDWVVKNLSVADNGTVLTERLDRFLINGKWLELPVMGAFELAGGKIRAWRDYFDLAQLRSGAEGI